MHTPETFPGGKTFKLTQIFWCLQAFANFTSLSQKRQLFPPPRWLTLRMFILWLRVIQFEILALFTGMACPLFTNSQGRTGDLWRDNAIYYNPADYPYPYSFIRKWSLNAQQRRIQILMYKTCDGTIKTGRHSTIGNLYLIRKSYGSTWTCFIFIKSNFLA